MKPKKDKAIIFELIIVFIFLGLLGWITWGQFSLAKAKSRDVERKTSLHEISKSVRLFYQDYGKLPEENLMNSLWGKEWRDGDYVYMTTVPKENYLKDKEYCYQLGSEGKTFSLFAELENKKDVDCDGNSWTCMGRSYCYRDVLEAEEKIN